MELPKSIFKYITTDENNIHMILPDKYEQLLNDKDYDTTDLAIKLRGNQFPQGLNPILVITPQKLKTKYTPALKNAIYKYREKNRDKYNEIARRSYDKNSKDDNWLEKRKEKQREYNRKYRLKKKQEKIDNDPNFVVRGKGRPRKK